MTIWEILGVPRGSDRDAIRRAYATRLRATHPEDDPEGFKLLRDAYERALANADFAARWPSDHQDGADEVDETTADDQTQDDLDDGTRWDEIDTAAALPDWRQPTQPEQDAADPVAAAELAARDVELAELRTLMSELEAGLRGPWRLGDQALDAKFAAILASPAMGEIGIRADIEPWLAHLLAETIPYSDAILQQAIDAFDWSNDRQGSYHWATAAALERFEEWRIIAALNQGSHPYHPGWRSLTRKPLPEPVWRLNTLRPRVRRGVAALLGEFGPVSPGLHHSFDQRSVDRWRAFFAKPRLTFGMLCQVPVLLGMLLWLRSAVAGGVTPNPFLGIATVIACLAPVVTLFGLAPARERLRRRYDPPRWQVAGWPFAYIAVVAAAMLLPGRWPVMFVFPALLIALWAYLSQPAVAHERRPFGGSLLLHLFFLLMAGTMIDAITPAQGFAVATTLALLGYLRIAHWQQADAILTARLGEAREWIILGGVIAGLALALIVTFWRDAWAPTLLFYPFVLATLALALPIGAPAGGSGPPRWIATLIALFALMLAVGASADDKGEAKPPVVMPGVPLATAPPQRGTWLDARSADAALAALAAEEPEFARVKEGNPRFHAALHDALDRYYRGDATRKEVTDAANALVAGEYRRRLLLVDAARLIEGQRIRLATLRALQDRQEVKACAEEATVPPPDGKIMGALQRRRVTHMFDVIATPPAASQDLERGRPVPVTTIINRAARAMEVTIVEFERRAGGKAGAGPQCAARIAMLAALLDTPDRNDIAATLRQQGKYR